MKKLALFIAGMALLGEVDWRDFMAQERKVFRKLLVKHENSKLSMPELASPAVDANPEDIPAWRKAVERFEKARAGDVLPALLGPKIPGANEPTATDGPDPSQSHAWRKAQADTEKAAAGGVLPPLPDRSTPRSALPAAAPAAP